MRSPEDGMNAESLERVYTNYASVYDQTFGKVFNESRESAVRGLAISPADTVLEVGRRHRNGPALIPQSLPSHRN